MSGSDEQRLRAYWCTYVQRVQKERPRRPYGEHMVALHAARFAAARDATALRGANEWHQRHAGTPAHTRRTDAGRTDRRRDRRAVSRANADLHAVDAVEQR